MWLWLQRVYAKYPISVALLGFIVCLSVDQAFALEMTESETLLLRKYAGVITDTALGIYWILFAILMILFLTLRIQFPLNKKSLMSIHNLRSWATHLLLSILTTGLIVITLKFVIGRERPFLNHGHSLLSFLPFSLNAIYQSFPSGHTQVVFCVAAMLAYLWPKSRNGFILLAGILALTRALTLNHFISDIYVGALIGFFGSQISVKLCSRWIPVPKALLQESLQKSITKT